MQKVRFDAPNDALTESERTFLDDAILSNSLALNAADELLAKEEDVAIAALIAIETATVSVARGSGEFDLDEFLAASQLSDDADIVTATTADPVAFISARVPFTELKPVIVNVGREQPLRKALVN